MLRQHGSLDKDKRYETFPVQATWNPHPAEAKPAKNTEANEVVRNTDNTQVSSTTPKKAARNTGKPNDLYGLKRTDTKKSEKGKSKEGKSETMCDQILKGMHGKKDPTIKYKKGEWVFDKNFNTLCGAPSLEALEQAGCHFIDVPHGL